MMKKNLEKERENGGKKNLDEKKKITCTNF